ncbi:UNVERIFIED_CONTAM: hypothetical protein HDU68_005575 [Siphonaria sp. JEL0065]|nr:hypothetical protein HDU68_005575 [Siphonaria sp. JEL0065]
MVGAANNCLVKPPKTRREVADRAIVMTKEMFENKPSAEIWQFFSLRDTKLSMNANKFETFKDLLKMSNRIDVSKLYSKTNTATVICMLIDEARAANSSGYDKDIKSHLTLANSLAILLGFSNVNLRDTDYIALLRLASGMMVSVLAPSILGGAVTSINLLSIALRLKQKQALKEPDVLRFDTGVKTLPCKSAPWKGYLPLCVPTQTVSGSSDYLNAAIDAWKNDQAIQTKIRGHGYTVEYRLPFDDDMSDRGKKIYVMKAPKIMNGKFEYEDLSIKWPSRDLDSFAMVGKTVAQCKAHFKQTSPEINPEMLIVLVSVYKLEWDGVGEKWVYSTSDAINVHVVLRLA